MKKRQEAKSCDPVLVIDDDEAQLRTLSDILEMDDFQPICCRTGKKALEVCNQNRVNVAILDLRLPDIEGLELLRQLKQRNPEIKVIIHTGYASLDSAMASLNEEAFAYVQKMGDVKNLLKHVHRAFHAHLISHSERLEQEVKKRTAELQRANEELKTEIAEHKRAEEALRESEERYRGVVEDTPVLICCFLPGGEITFVNKAYCEYFARTPEELVGSNFLSLIPEDDRETVMANISALTVELPTQSHEHRVIAPDGEIRWQRWTNRALFDAQGKVVAYQSIGEDITERKQAEETLRLREQQLSLIYDSTGDILFYLKVEPGPHYRFISVNRAFLKATGLTVEQIVGKTINEIIPEPSLKLVRSNYEKAIRKKRIVHWEETSQYPTGLKTGIVSIAPVFNDKGNCSHLVGSVHDITERKRVEEALKGSEDKLKEAQKVGKLGHYVFNITTDCWTSSDELDDIFGIDKTYQRDVEGWLQIVHPDFAETMENYLQDHVLKQRQKFDKEYKIINIKTKQEKWVHGLGNLKFDANNNPVEMFGTIQDITEHKQAEAELRESEKKFRTLFEESQDAVFFSTPEGKFLDINTAGVELFGYTSKQELLQVDIARNIYSNPHDREDFRKILHKRGFVKDYELILKKKNGEKITVLETATVVRDENERITSIRGIMRDVTERKKLEEQLLQAQKMETIGTLAGGVAHDFNNLLTAILGNASFGLQEIKPDNPAYEYLIEIEKAGERASNLTNQLLSFSRRQTLRKEIIDLNHAIDDLLKMLRRILGEDIQLVVEFSPKTATVLADAGQMQQVLMNLFANARDAMPHGGTLTLKTDILPKEQLAGYLQKKDSLENYVQIVVSDTGSGIDKESLPRIFDPFYTTKEVGKGTGLGLAVVHGIVEQHEGHVQVESESGKGTTFKIFLPAVEKTASAIENEKKKQSIPGNGETIIVVEDDKDVRYVTSRILKALGYKVLAAQDAEEAMHIFEKEKDRIDLVVTDVVMPKRSGPEMYSQMNRLKPKLPVLFVTGYDYDHEIEKLDGLHKLTFRSVLQKPFTKDILSQKIREVMEGQ